MKKKAAKPEPHSVAADVTQWSTQSKQSVAFHFRREYRDEPYQCVRCQAACLFTAQDQKYTYKRLKASIGQRRVLCRPCWDQLRRLQAQLRKCEAAWADSKAELRADGQFLANWLRLLQDAEKCRPGKRDAARKNMLVTLLARASKDTSQEGI